MNNPLGRILKGVDETDRPDVHLLGELLLNLSSDAWGRINGWVRNLAARARRDGKSHDVTIPLNDDHIGLTIHCNDLPNPEAFEKLTSHCIVRKYAHKSDQWFGVCLSADSEEVRFAIGRLGRWEYDAVLEKEAADLKVRSVRNWVDASNRRGKVGRNSPCPCGSGVKYKRCHGAA
ncbi:MAG TPA: SEC-C metal-binding domain-containing protein [Allosphingosinicella sp.]